MEIILLLRNRRETSKYNSDSKESSDIQIAVKRDHHIRAFHLTDEGFRNPSDVRPLPKRSTYQLIPRIYSKDDLGGSFGLMQSFFYGMLPDVQDEQLVQRIVYRKNRNYQGQQRQTIKHTLNPRCHDRGLHLCAEDHTCGSKWHHDGWQCEFFPLLHPSYVCFVCSL